MSQMDDGNDDKELVAIYDTLLQYFEPFGYPRRQLIEAIKEANVGPQLNDFNVNRLFEFLSFQNESSFAEEVPEQKTKEPDRTERPDTSANCSLPPENHFKHERAKPTECGLPSKTTSQPQVTELSNAYNYMITQLCMLGYSNTEARHGVIATNVNPFVTDENINRVVEFLERSKGSNDISQSGQEPKNVETSQPVQSYFPSEVRHSCDSTTASLPPCTDATPYTALSNEASTSAVIKATYKGHASLQDNHVSSTSKSHAVSGNQPQSLPANLPAKQACEDNLPVQDNTVTSLPLLDTPVHALEKNSINHGDKSSPTAVQPPATEKPAPNTPEPTVDDFVTSSKLDLHEKLQRIPSLPPLPSLGEVFGVHSLPLATKLSSIKDEIPPRCLSDPTVNIVVNEAPSSEPPAKDEEDLVLHSVSLKSLDSNASLQNSAPDVHEISEAHEFEELRSKVVPFDEAGSEHSSCHESCDCDSESLHSYTLLSDPSVVVKELPTDAVANSEMELEKLEMGDEAFAHSKQPSYQQTESTYASSFFVVKDRDSISSLNIPKTASATEKPTKVHETMHFHVKGPPDNISTTTVQSENSPSLNSSLNANQPSTSKLSSDKIPSEQGFVNPYMADTSLSSTDYSTIDIYNFSSSKNLSGSFKLSEAAQSEMQNPSSTEGGKLVKITPKELKLQMDTKKQVVPQTDRSLSSSPCLFPTPQLSSEFGPLIKRTKLLGYSQESIVDAIIATNVNPKVSDVSIGILSDYLDSNAGGVFSMGDSHYISSLENATQTDGAKSLPRLHELEENGCPTKQILPLHLAGDATSLDREADDETGEIKSACDENCSKNELYATSMENYRAELLGEFNSLPALLQLDSKDSDEVVMLNGFYSLDENAAVKDDSMAVLGQTLEKTQSHHTMTEKNVSDRPETLSIREKTCVCEVKDPHSKLADQTSHPSDADEEIVSLLLKEIVDLAAEQVAAIDHAEQIVRKQNKIDEEFNALVQKVQRLGFRQRMVERAIKATNVNPSVGDVSVGIVVDYLENMSQCSDEGTDSETESEEQEYVVDTTAEDDVKLLVQEMVAFVDHNDDDEGVISMEKFSYFIPHYWLACEREAEKKRRKEEAKIYEKLTEAVAEHNYDEMSIKAAIEATNVGPVVCEENIQRLLEYLQENAQQEDTTEPDQTAEDLIEIIESLPKLMKEVVEEAYYNLAKHLNDEKYADMVSDDFAPLVKLVKSQNPKMEWSSKNIKQAILYTNVPPKPCDATMAQIKAFLLEKKPELDQKIMLDVKGKVKSLSDQLDMELDVADMLFTENLLEDFLNSPDGSKKAEIHGTAVALIKISEVAPEMLKYVQDYCFCQDAEADESLKSEPQSLLASPDKIAEDIYHKEVLEKVSAEEWDLAKKLRDICDSNGKEETKKESAPIFHQLGKIYRLKSPHKVDLLRSAGLFNAAIVREPDNVDKIREDLHELYMHVLNLSGAKTQNASLVDASDTFLEEIKTMRDKAKSSLNSLQNIGGENEYYQDDMDGFKSQMFHIEQCNESFEKKWDLISDQVEKAFDPIKSFVEMVELIHEGNSETKAQEEKKINQMMEIQEGLTRDFIHIMKFISDYCIDVLGDPPCAFAQAGMGSLARKEVTPYSDFENMILLQDGVETRPDFPQIQEYFRWYSVIFQIILINFGETVLPSLAIPSLNDFHKDGENWFFDAYTGNGISFDGLMPHACKSPLGWQYGTPNNPGTSKELIQPVSKMVEFVDCNETKNDFHLSDMLLCTCFVAGMPDVYERYLELIKTKLKGDIVDDGLNEQLHHTMAQDIHNFNGLKGVTDMLLSMKWNVKKTIYRPTTIFISSLGREKRAHSSSSFEILSELLDKEIIERHIAHKLKYAVALACEIRLRIYLKKDRQEDWIDSEELPSCDLAMLVELIGVRNTYEYFSIVIFLHMFIESVLEHGKVVLPYSEKGLLFCLPHLLEYIVFCTEVTFEFGSRLMLATGNDLLNDFVNYKLINMDKIFKALEEKTDPEIIKAAIESLSRFSSFLAVRGLFKEAMLCGMMEMHFQLSLQRGKSLNLARWSRSLTSNVFKNLSSYHKWDTLHLIDKFGKPKDGQK